MRLESKNPEALASAVRADNSNTFAGNRNSNNSSADDTGFQVAYVASRYRLSPCMARLICHLAEIGGRLA